MNIEEIHSK